MHKAYCMEFRKEEGLLGLMLSATKVLQESRKVLQDKVLDGSVH